MDPLTARPIQTGWEFTMEPYRSGQFGCIGNLDTQFGNGLVWIWIRTRSDGPQPLLTLGRKRVVFLLAYTGGQYLDYVDH
jgi:hypothetical protein